MGRHRAAQADRRRLGLKIRAILAGGLALGVGATVTLAAWNDSEYATTTVTTSRFDIVGDMSGSGTFVDHNPEGTPPSAAGAIAYSPSLAGVSPGTTTYGAVRIRTTGGATPSTVGGTVVLQTPTTFVSGSADLATAMQVTVRAYDTGVACNASIFTNNVGTSIVAQQNLSTAIAPAAQPAQSLSANAGNTVTYCIRLALPTGASNALQGQNATVTWQFLATSSS